MTHDELLAKIDVELVTHGQRGNIVKHSFALRAVVELHKPRLDTVTGKYYCDYCDWIIDCQDCHIYTSQECEYPCPTIEAIEKELE